MWVLNTIENKKKNNNRFCFYELPVGKNSAVLISAVRQCLLLKRIYYLSTLAPCDNPREVRVRVKDINGHTNYKKI